MRALAHIRKLILIASCLWCQLSFATHIVGGEVYYDDLGGGNYKIHMKVYRDCFNGIPPFDGLPDANGGVIPPYFSIFDGNNNFIARYQFPAPSHSNIPPTINNPCIQPPNGVCVEEGVYEMTVNLPPRPGGYYIAYQRCCRNGTILNLVNPGGVGATYWEHIPGPELVGTNSSPRFNDFPPIFICSNTDINFDHSASDPDGDVLVYSICSPFEGLTAACPIVGNGGGCPVNNTPPPYTGVPFLPPYSASAPMASNPAMNINPTTGYLTGKPTINGQWVVGICVSEYRNGVLIGVHHRDFQFNVVNCIVNVVSAIQDQSTFCTGLNVDFGNHSQSNIGALSYFWDFGDLATLGDTSHLATPSYTYPAPGTYTVMLVANPGQPCTDTAVSSFTVSPLLDIDFTAPPGQCLNGNSFSFAPSGAFQGNGSFGWSFGANSITPFSGVQSPSGVSFTTSGIFPVKLVIAENGCKDSVIHDVQVYAMPTANFESTPLEGCDPFTVTLNNSSTADTPMSYTWLFSDGGSSTVRNPTHTFTPPGVYSVSLTIVTSNGCIDTSRFSAANMINVLPIPHSQFAATPTITTIFDPDISFFDASSEGAISWYYDFGDGSNSTLRNVSHAYGNWGDYYVTQTVTNQYGCPNSSQLLIRILPEFRFWAPNSFTPGNRDGLNDVFKPVVIGVSNYSFMVFNRWGELIYKTGEIEEGWNGSFKGKESPIDVYVWKCTFTNVVTKVPEEHVGHVTLVR